MERTEPVGFSALTSTARISLPNWIRKSRALLGQFLGGFEVSNYGESPQGNQGQPGKEERYPHLGEVGWHTPTFKDFNSWAYGEVDEEARRKYSEEEFAWGEFGPGEGLAGWASVVGFKSGQDRDFARFVAVGASTGAGFV